MLPGISFLLTLLLILLLRLPACDSEATSLVRGGPPLRNPDPGPLNSSQLYNATPVSLIPDNETLPIPLPHSFFVPDTETYLRLGFGLVRHRLDPLSLGGLIAVMQHEILRGINQYGEDTYVGFNILAYGQRFQWTLGDGFHFEIHNVKSSNRFFTWKQLENVVEGLRLFLVVGERPFAPRFRFWDGAGWSRTRTLGDGGFVGDRVGSGEIATLKG